MKKLTVFTPTFNRAYCLGQVYESLVRQTSQDFLWLVVDDGSADNTKELVDSWIADRKISLEYIYKKNGGMHTAHNAAYKHITTPLNVCIDSDDFMPDDAVEKILATWDKSGSDIYAGIIGLDAFKDGKIIGTPIPENVRESTLTGLYSKHNVSGDKKVVLRTDVVRRFPPYPEFESERLVPLGTLYRMIDSAYTFICSNDVYCIVEYLPDGSSGTILKQYRKSPNGFFHARVVEMTYSHGLKHKFTRAMHLISSAIFARRNPFKGNPEKLITAAAFPFGLLLHGYILIKTRK